jgi:hypothetical protein
MLSALVCAFFLAQSSVAYALAALELDRCGDCCDGDGGSSPDEPLCPCPIKCAQGCAGSSLRAVAPAAPELELAFFVAIELAGGLPDRLPASPDPPGILHVPKTDRA